jgi:putative membrane protein
MWSWWDCMRWWDSAAWDGTTPWFMFLSMLWPIVMIGGIIVLVMLVMRSGRTETPPTWRRDAGRQTPFEILSERFARGEIDKEEYEDRKRLLPQSAD